MSRIKTIDEAKAEGKLKEIYSAQKNYGIKLASIYKVQGIKPGALLNHLDLHAELIYANSELTRAERELIIVIVSLANGCKYCQFRHADFLNKEWKNEIKIAQVFIDYEEANLTEREKTLCQFAKELTMIPEDFEDAKYVNKLREIGLTDSGILDVVLVVSFANYINRIALALDLNPELHATDDSGILMHNLKS